MAICGELSDYYKKNLDQMKTKKSYYLFAWATGKGLNRRFYYSLRTVQRPDNSVDTSDCGTRQGRNVALNRVLDAKDPYRLGIVEVIRQTNPAEWLKERAKKK